MIYYILKKFFLFFLLFILIVQLEKYTFLWYPALLKFTLKCSNNILLMDLVMTPGRSKGGSVFLGRFVFDFQSSYRYVG